MRCKLRKSVWKIFFGIFLVVLFTQAPIVTSASTEAQNIIFSGSTMGTTYRIQAQIPRSVDVSQLAKEIDVCLEKINTQMSTFRSESEISRFNRMLTGSMTVSDDFYTVMKASKQLYKITDGAWDGTVYPLMKIWNFFIKGETPKVPSDKEIKTAIQNVGFDNIGFAEKNQLIKKKEKVQVDLASIAKGYGVDQLMALLKQKGVINGFVEIGGEVLVSGTKPDGSLWKVGIMQPDESGSQKKAYRTIELKNQAIATSGTYQNFFKKNGVTYSHIIDPKTGRPVQNGVVSVSVVAPTCMEADGLATALMVMGASKGIELIKTLPNVSCCILVIQPDGKIRSYRTASFPKWVL